MRNANWTRILTILLSLLALYALLAVLAGVIQRFITPLLLIVLASIIAFVLSPVVDLFQRTLRVYRWAAILITYVLLLCLVGSLGYFMATPLIDQTKALTDAIKNPPGQKLHAVKALETSALAFAAQAQVYQWNTAQTNVNPSTRLKSCIGSSVGALPRRALTLLSQSGPCAPAPCYAAYFLKVSGSPGPPSPIWTGSGCGSDKPSANNLIYSIWRNSDGVAKPFQTFRPLTGSLLSALNNDLSQLSRTSVRTSGGKGSPDGGRIPTTQVPTTYTKATSTALSKLTTDLNRAVLDARNGVGTSYKSDAARVYKDAQSLAAASKALFHKVKSTPLIVLATQNFFDQHHIPINVGNAVTSAISKARGQSTTVLNNVVAILTGTLNVIFDVIIILIMSLYLLADGGRFIGWVMGLVPEANREQAWFFVRSLNRVLGGYIRGQLLVAITIGILAGAGCAVIGIPYPLLLGIFAFLAESIPVMGPIIASVPAVLVALFTVSLLRTVFVVAWFIVIQQIEQNVVGPRITGHAVGIHPVVAMIAVIVGLEIGGIWGAFLAVPVAGILFVVVGEAYNYLILRRPLPKAEVPESLEIDVVTVEESAGA